MKYKHIFCGTLSKLLGNKRQQIMIVTAGSLIVNLLYAVYNGVLGIWGQSVWFITMGMYYATLSVMRFLVVKADKATQMSRELSIMKTVGILLFFINFYPDGFHMFIIKI